VFRVGGGRPGGRDDGVCAGECVEWRMEGCEVGEGFFVEVAGAREIVGEKRSDTNLEIVGTFGTRFWTLQIRTSCLSIWGQNREQGR
jgi:hypothetical protein